jgi:hypothetical protein
LARRILALDPLGQHIHLYYAREYMPSLLKQDNVILIGSPIANPWDELFESRLAFTATLNNGAPTFITDHAPAAGEQSSYIPTGSVGYCTVAFLPNPDHNGSVLLRVQRPQKLPATSYYQKTNYPTSRRCST